MRVKPLGSRKKSGFMDNPLNKYLFIIGLILIVAIPILFLNFGVVNPITGLVSVKYNAKAVNFDLSEGQVYILSTKNPEPLDITSFSISGEIIGNGQVEVYLQSRDVNLIIFKNVKNIDTGLSALTGAAIKSSEGSIEISSSENLLILNRQPEKVDLPHTEVSKDEEVFSGKFFAESGEASFISMTLSQKDVVRLVFNIEPGTMLKVNDIIYTIKQ